MMDVTRRSDIGLLLAERGLLGAAADVGVATGRTALESLRWGFQKVYLVDLWAEIRGDLCQPSDEQDAVFAECMEKVSPYIDRVIVLRGWSHEMASEIPDESLDYLSLDGGHGYEVIKRDLQCYYHKVKSGVGAITWGHDYGNPALGVKRAVDEFMAPRGITLHVLPVAEEVDASFWFEKE